MSWWYSAKGTLSLALLNSLVHDVLLQPGFDTDDLQGFSAEKEMRRMDSHQQDSSSNRDGWREGSVTLTLPCGGLDQGSEDAAMTFEVTGILYRPLLDIICGAFKHPSAKAFHLVPYRLLHYSTSDPTAAPEELSSEIYNCPTVIEEHRKVQDIPFASTVPESQRHAESVVATIPLYSDSTSLAQFGTASLWPIYLWIGNLSKYVRNKMGSFSAQHVAYLPSLPDKINDAYKTKFGKYPSAAVLTFLKRELVQAIWQELLLTPEFEDAYKNGIMLEFLDGIIRRLFPRLVHYSADYPEKTILASIKSLGRHPCPRCEIPKDLFADMGTLLDKQHREEMARQDSDARQERVETARGMIFEQGYVVNGEAIDKTLGGKSETPNRNAFSWSDLGTVLNYFTLFTVDLMHEFELGVWKAILIHLIRILQAHGQAVVHTLNTRYVTVLRA
ncbi:hypothetical protein BD626DRAFT_373491, partial [Schizophyllum amplum]